MPKADFSISPYGRAVCPVCGDDISLLKNGTLRHHVNKKLPYNGMPFGQRCTGAGRLPGEQQPESATATPPVGPKPKESIEDRRRRLEADAEDARKALQRARARFEGLCDELVELQREEQGA
jgi:hypothetical protein